MFLPPSEFNVSRLFSVRGVGYPLTTVKLTSGLVWSSWLAISLGKYVSPE